MEINSIHRGEMIAWTAWGYFWLFSLQQHSSVLSMFSDYFSPFPLKPFILTHFFLDIVWKVAEWLFKIVFRAIDVLEGWEQRGHCAVAAPGSRWWHWCQLLRGMRLLLSDVCGDEWLYTQKKSPCTICYHSAQSFNSMQYPTPFAVASWSFLPL